MAALGLQLQERGSAVNGERTFDYETTTAKPAIPSPADLERRLARAHQADAGLLGPGFGRSHRSLRAALAALARWHEQRRTRQALMACSDRVLADIGIAREHIPLVAKGIDPAEYQQRDPVLRRWWVAAHVRVDAARAARWERRRLYRELDAYSDRELEEIGLRRGDIPLIARGRPVLRRAA
jgi:uncharacterized protein YjiS (DUF1127 family)